jgi:hypothetical protein
VNRRTAGWALAGTGTLLTLVAAVGAVGSYRHAVTVATDHGDPVMAPWIPVTTDGLIVLAGAAILIRRAAGERVGWVPWTAFVAGLAMTFALNSAAAYPGGWGYALALWPPAVFTIAFEVAVRMARPAVAILRAAVDTDRSAPVHPTFPAAGPWTVDTADEDETAPEPIRAGLIRAEITMPDRTDEPDRTALTDDEIVQSIRSVMDRSGRSVPSQRFVRDTYRVGPGRAKRIVERIETDRRPVRVVR